MEGTSRQLKLRATHGEVGLRRLHIPLMERDFSLGASGRSNGN